MKIFRYTVILVAAVSMISASCTKLEKLPPEPSIEYNNFVIFDTTDILGNIAKGGRLNFDFKDGDGDLGMEAPEESESDTTNIFIKLFRVKNGVHEPAFDTDPLRPSTYRLPYMEKQGQNKLLKGSVSITFIYLFYSPADTITYEFQIRDRAGHFSNTASTGEIVLSVNGTY